jgi:hypothetical protein
MKNRIRQRQKLALKMIILIVIGGISIFVMALLYFNFSDVKGIKAAQRKIEIRMMEEQSFLNDMSLPMPLIKPIVKSDQHTIFIQSTKPVSESPQ